MKNLLSIVFVILILSWAAGFIYNVGGTTYIFLLLVAIITIAMMIIREQETINYK
jgi:hypothetical protein